MESEWEEETVLLKIPAQEEESLLKLMREGGAAASAESLRVFRAGNGRVCVQWPGGAVYEVAERDTLGSVLICERREGGAEAVAVTESEVVGVVAVPGAAPSATAAAAAPAAAAAAAATEQVEV